ncbi:hypothetical protein [Microbacterium sp. NPDC077184]|uniref:hypothetical protein n=1 Tax=Microbacterium sp. NPDC077184 TaxID=3154764 RepID=UPI0034491589
MTRSREDVIEEAGEVLVGSRRLVRSVWMLLGLGCWLIVAAICVGIAGSTVWPIALVASAIAGAATAAAVWTVVGGLRMRIRLQDTRLTVRGWLWREDIVVPREDIEGGEVVEFFDPRLHGLYWIRGNRNYPRKLQLQLRTGDTVGIPSSFGPEQLLRRQAARVNEWCAASDGAGSATGDASDKGYRIDTMPRFVAWFPCYQAAAVLGVISVAVSAVGSFAALGLSVACAAGFVAGFGRLARRMDRSDPDFDEVF